MRIVQMRISQSIMLFMKLWVRMQFRLKPLIVSQIREHEEPTPMGDVTTTVATIAEGYSPTSLETEMDTRYGKCTEKYQLRSLRPRDFH